MLRRELIYETANKNAFDLFLFSFLILFLSVVSKPRIFVSFFLDSFEFKANDDTIGLFFSSLDDNFL